MRIFIVYFRYQKPVDKKPGPITHQKIRAETIDQAREFARQYANYPGIELVRVEEAPHR